MLRIIIIPSNSKITAKPDKLNLTEVIAVRLKDGIHVTFNTSGYDFGGNDSINVNYNWTGSINGFSIAISNKNTSFRKKFPILKIIIFRCIQF